MRSQTKIRARGQLSIMVLLTAALFSTSGSAQELGDDVVATVNGVPISQYALDAVALQVQQSGEQFDESAIINELVNLELLTQKAEAIDLHEEEEIKTLLKLQYNQMMARTYMGNLSRELEVTDDEVKAAYDDFVANSAEPEYRASHILLDDEAAANDVIKALNDGGSFEELARERSTGPSGESGGDLGWFQANSMVPEFSAALTDMATGTVSEAPVQTQFGWHVIKLVDKRETNAPSFEAVEAEIRNGLVGQKLTDQVTQFRQEADIKIRE